MRPLRLTFLLAASLPITWLGARAVESGAATSAATTDSVAAAAAESRVRQRDVEIAAWERALAQDSLSAIALAQLGGLHMQRGRESGEYADYVRAEEYARRSLALRTNRNGRSFLTLSASLLAQHRFVEARDVARRLVAREPEVPQYRALLGEADLELGDYDAARAAFDSIPGRDRAHLSIAPRLARWAELAGRTDDARRILTAARDRAAARADLPREQVAWFDLRLGDLELRAGHPNAARRAYELGLAAAPGDYRLLGAMARLAAALGDADAAIDYGERAIRIMLDPATLGVVSDAYAARGDRGRAEEYARAMEVAVAGQPGPYHRAWALFLLDHDHRVPEVLARAEEEIRTRHDIYGDDLLAWALHKSGRDGEARHASAAALRLGTADATLHYHAGAIALSSGDTAAARAALARALAINPRFDPRLAAAARRTLGGLERAAAPEPWSW